MPVLFPELPNDISEDLKIIDNDNSLPDIEDTPIPKKESPFITQPKKKFLSHPQFLRQMKSMTG